MQGIARPLLAWYARRARDLPWRRTRDPYAIWVSEIMLQQTQADRVGDYFARFLRRFPTVAVLAAAPESAILKAWEGLGYYRRARQLRAAARSIVNEHAGQLPDTADVLRTLPGVGRYTAAAIASIAFDRREPIVEANSRRVIARIVAHTGGFERPSDDEPIWRIAARLLPKTGAGRFNQALMDLGAMVCTPTDPSCDACPLARRCEAHRLGLTAEIPRRKSVRGVQRRRERAVVYRRGVRVLLERRGPGEWWTGLWDFPREPMSPRKAAQSGDSPADRTLGTFSYAVTHHRIDVVVVERKECVEARNTEKRGRHRTRKSPSGSPNGPVTADSQQGGIPARDRPVVRWVSVDDLASFAMTAPARRVAKMVSSSGSEGPRMDRGGRVTRERKSSCHVRRSRSRTEAFGSVTRSVRRARSSARCASTPR